MILRALWIWLRWIGARRPKLCRLALASAFCSIRSSSSACTHGAVFRCALDQPKRVLDALTIDAIVATSTAARHSDEKNVEM